MDPQFRCTNCYQKREITRENRKKLAKRAKKTVLNKYSRTKWPNRFWPVKRRSRQNIKLMTNNSELTLTHQIRITSKYFWLKIKNRAFQWLQIARVRILVSGRILGESQCRAKRQSLCRIRSLNRQIGLWGNKISCVSKTSQMCLAVLEVKLRNILMIWRKLMVRLMVKKVVEIQKLLYSRLFAQKIPTICAFSLPILFLQFQMLVILNLREKRDWKDWIQVIRRVVNTRMIVRMEFKSQLEKLT